MSLPCTFQRLLARIAGLFCASMFTTLVLAVVWGVITRHHTVLNDRLPRLLHIPEQPAWTEELARLLLVWLALLGGVLAYAEDRHLGVDALISRLHPDGARNARLTAHLCVLGFSLAALVIGGTQLFISRLESGQMMTSLPIRKAWFYFVLPVAGLLVAILSICKAITLLSGNLGREEPR